MQLFAIWMAPTEVRSEHDWVGWGLRSSVLVEPTGECMWSVQWEAHEVNWAIILTRWCPIVSQWLGGHQPEVPLWRRISGMVSRGKYLKSAGTWTKKDLQELFDLFPICLRLNWFVHKPCNCAAQWIFVNGVFIMIKWWVNICTLLAPPPQITIGLWACKVWPNVLVTSVRNLFIFAPEDPKSG